MTPRLWGWVALLVIASAYEVWGVLDPTPNDTLSELTRRVFHVSTLIGGWVFLVLWGVLGAWFAVHIMRKSSEPQPLRSVPKEK